jgi:hypothetical protein
MNIRRRDSKTLKHLGTFCQITGFLGVMIALLLGADLLMNLRTAAMPQRIDCVNNLKQIGLAFRTWALDHGDRFPFNVSTNEGGTLQLCARNADGFDSNASRHCQVMSNELSTPRILVCPDDPSKKAETKFENLKPGNVTYRIRSGTNLSEGAASEILALCPIDGNAVHCDGNVIRGLKPPKPREPELVFLWRYHEKFREGATDVLVSLAAAMFLVAFGTYLKLRIRNLSKK